MLISRNSFCRLLIGLAVMPLFTVHARLESPFADSTLIWKRVTVIHPGMIHQEICLNQPRPMRIQAVHIDLHTPGLRLATFEPPTDAGQPMPGFPDKVIRTKREKVSDFLLNCRKPVKEGGRGLNMVLAVNACPWSPWQPPWNHPYADSTGLLVSEGKLVSPNTGRPGLVVTKSGQLEFRSFPPKNTEISIDDIQLCICGFSMILRDGKILPQDSKDYHPRTVYGLSADHRWFYVIIVDGRQKGYSEGANTHECAQIAQQLGASEAINMDGGGSTTLISWDAASQTPQMLNRHEPTRRSQRKVGGAIGFYYVQEASDGEIKQKP